MSQPVFQRKELCSICDNNSWDHKVRRFFLKLFMVFLVPMKLTDNWKQEVQMLHCTGCVAFTPATWCSGCFFVVSLLLMSTVVALV